MRLKYFGYFDNVYYEYNIHLVFFIFKPKRVYLIFTQTFKMELV